MYKIDNLDIAEARHLKKERLMKSVIENVIIFAIMLIFCNAKISGIVAPFGIGFAYALLACKKNPTVFGIGFVLSYVITSLTIEGVVISMCYLCAMISVWFIYWLTKKQIKLWAVFVALMFGSLGYIYYGIQTSIEIVQTIIMILISSMFLLVCQSVIRAIISRGLIFKFTLDEQVCLCICIAVFGCGLFGVAPFGINISAMVVCFGMLFTLLTFGSKSALFFATLSGIGLAFASGSVASLAVFCAWAVIATAMKDQNRLLICVGVLSIDFLMGAYFNGYPTYGWQNLITIVLPCIAFVLIPKKQLSKLKIWLSSEWQNSYNFVMDYQQKQIKARLGLLSKVFESMGEVYYKLVNGNINKKDACEALSNEVINRTCRKCENYSKCMREKNISHEITKLTLSSLEKGKASLMDVSKNLAINCMRTTSLLSAINDGLDSYKKYETMIETEDSGRIAVAEQLVATSHMFSSMLSEIENKTAINEPLSKQIEEELMCGEIITKEVLVIENDKGFDRLVMVVRSDMDFQKLNRIISKFLKIETTCMVYDGACPGFKQVILKENKKYDIVVGVSSLAKNNSTINGDVYSYIDLSDDKYLLAICDGMGSGEEARMLSENTISLIENYYRAGFESRLILNSISNLLKSNGREIFSTLDAIVFDAKTGNTDFIKACAPACIIKSKEQSKLIEGDAPPLGVSTDSIPTVKMERLGSGDIVVLASDGVVDCFDNPESYMQFINSEKIINMNLLSQSILEEALTKIGGVAKDDMTVVCMRIA